MMSRTQARLFFVGGTVFFSAIFLFLTVDTVQQVPKQTKQHNITAEVLRGKEIWEENNCMGCHTIMGEGAYYAPELTKAVERRGEAWLKVFLKDPEKMYPGERKMVNYHFNDGQISDVIAFLKWIGEMDLNGFPKKPDLQVASIGGASALKTSGVKAPEKYSQLCSACHAVGGSGGNVGPALDAVGKKFDVAYLDKWLKDPQAVKPGTAMPQLPLTDTERREIVQFLSSLK